MAARIFVQSVLRTKRGMYESPLLWLLLFVSLADSFSFTSLSPSMTFVGSRVLPLDGDKCRKLGALNDVTGMVRLSRSRRQRCSRAVTTCALSATVVPVSLNIVISKILGYCMVAGSFFLQLPQLIKILKNKSVLGLSTMSRYSEVPINSSAVIYHYLKRLPFSSYGENVIVLVQNLACVGLLWTYKVPRIQLREMILVTSLFIALCAVELSLPPPLQPLLIYLNLPLVLGTTFPQVLENFRQGHTGQLAILTCFLKFVGCSVRIFTTLSLIGPDVGLLSTYGAGAFMNAVLVGQGIVYRAATAAALERDIAARASSAPLAQGT